MSCVRSIRLVFGVVGAAVALAACGSDAPSDTSGSSGAITVEQAGVREPAAGQTTVAAYATVVNGTDHAVTLRDATSPLTDDVSVHETMVAGDGTMSMDEPDGGLTIEAGASIVLEPGGAHVMLDDVDAADVVTPVEVTFVFDDGSDADVDVTVDAEVRALDGSDVPSDGAPDSTMD
jgi:copper(I)-binding protein